MVSWADTQTQKHYNDVITNAIASQITSLTVVYSTVYSDADQGKHQSSASLAFVRGFHRGPVNSPHKWPVTRKMFPFDDVIMIYANTHAHTYRLHTHTHTDHSNVYISSIQDLRNALPHKPCLVSWQQSCLDLLNNTNVDESSLSA